mmetsp:Transcript_23704/g.42604  ORF Transcript_23704/g.42604 Transcript_23704/m.42604 type:complete len:124 (+) Transcript_23704:450-821(+)
MPNVANIATSNEANDQQSAASAPNNNEYPTIPKGRSRALQLPTTTTTTPCYLHLHTLYNTTNHHDLIHNSTHPPLLLSHHPHELMQRFEAIWSQFMQPSSNKQQQHIRDDGTKTHNTINYVQQ